MTRVPLIAFCQVPKTAGVSLTRALRSTFGLRHADVEPRAGQGLPNVYGAADHRWTRRLHPGLRSIAGHRVSPAVSIGADDVTWCTVLRDPVERTMSHYRFQVRHHGYTNGLQEWIDERAVADLHCRHIAGVADADAAIEILSSDDCEWDHVDNLDLLLARLADRLDEPRLRRPVGRHNVAPEPVDITATERELLASINREDQRLFEWACSIRPPRALDAPAEPTTTPSKHRDRFASASARIWRNVVYRPALSIDRRLGRPSGEPEGGHRVDR